MRWLILAATLMWTPGLLNAQEATDAAREAEVLSAVRAFHEALAAGDSTAALERLHPAVTIYESGHAETLTEYRGGHLPADIAFASATERELTKESVTVWGDRALYTAESHTSGQWRGRDIDAHGTETIVLLRTAEGWRIGHIHWSSR